MKNMIIKTVLLLIGTFCVSLFVMPAERTEERQSLQHQKAAVIDIALSVDLQLIALDALSQSSNNEVIDMSKVDNLFTHKRVLVFKTEKNKCIRSDLKKSGTDTYIVYLENNVLYKLRANENLNTKDEVRIRGRPVIIA